MVDIRPTQQASDDMPSSIHAWAKLSDHDGSLPLADHAGDVAVVMRELITIPILRARLNHCAVRCLTAQDCERLVTLAFLHDLGKVNRGFWERQFSGKPRIGHTNETAALFFTDRIKTTATAQRLSAVIEKWGAQDLFIAAMAHHGRPLEAYADGYGGLPAREALKVSKATTGHWSPTDGYDPLDQLTRLLDAAEARFPTAFAKGAPLPAAAPFVSVFCGLLTLADWLGSDTSLFAIGGPHGVERTAMQSRVAFKAIVSRGLGPINALECSFASAFAVDGPRGLQSMAHCDGLGPIALIEAETGSGKTEAALWRWLALRKQGLVDGLYFALPTRSAAVQLHGRVQTMLDRVVGSGTLEAVLAVPGYLRAGEAEGSALPDFGVVWSDDDVSDRRWAAERPKRFLAARVAVGTIDQVLMAGLQLRHAHLRAAALSRSLLVVDEVHASDAFMGELLSQVLDNHRAFGGHALLLSATLTASARLRLLGGGDSPVPTLVQAVSVPYPALSGVECDPIAGETVGQTAKRVALQTMPIIDDPEAIAEQAVAAARRGASVLVIRNSVSGAIAVARAVEALASDLAFRVRRVATLHHGRFAPVDRRQLDAAVESAFGRGRSAQGRILCGTQTLEQSLDIDADLLITDLAPMDVLLQRIGRLHRHRRTDRGKHASARAVVLVPRDRDLKAFLGRKKDRHGLGPIRDGAGVYPDLLVLEATWRLVAANALIDLPEDNRRLVEGALHPEVADLLKHELGTAWSNHANVQDGTALAERNLAQRWRLDLTAPFDTLLFPDLDEAIATRLGTRDRSVDVDPAVSGPFGHAVDRLNIPGWMAGGIPPEVEPVFASSDAEGLQFRLGDRGFRYSRWGLELDGAELHRAPIGP